MEEPKEYYTHTIELGKERKGSDKELIDFLKSGRPIFIDMKTRKIIEIKTEEEMTCTTNKPFELLQKCGSEKKGIEWPNPIFEEERKLKAENKILHLTLSKAPFEVMATGEKVLEYREDKEWIRSRLIDKKTGKEKEFDLIKFSNGYNSNSPRFYCKYEGFFNSSISCELEYSNGFKHEVEAGMIVIACGQIVLKIN